MDNLSQKKNLDLLKKRMEEWKKEKEELSIEVDQYLKKQVSLKKFITQISKLNLKPNIIGDSNPNRAENYAKTKTFNENTIFIPVKFDERFRDNIYCIPNYLSPIEYWIVELDKNKMNACYLSEWLQESLFQSDVSLGQEFKEENIKKIMVDDHPLEIQEAIYRNIMYSRRLIHKAQSAIYQNLQSPYFLKLEDIISDIPDLEFENLIKKDESVKHEYKSYLRYNTKEKKITDWLINSSLKTISAFLNSEGGNLIIGVDDDKNVLGFELDGFKNDDEWIRFLKDKIKSKLGLKFLETFIKIEVRKSKEKSIGIVRCAALPQNEHCLLEDKLYVRKGPSSHELPVKEALNWFQNRVQKSE